LNPASPYVFGISGNPRLVRLENCLDFIHILFKNLVIPRQKRTKPTRLPKYSGGNRDLTNIGGREE
jgi:hypothetical protein